MTYCMHRAVADGPNHSPGYFPHATAPCLTKFWREYGARISSENSANISRSASGSVALRQPDHADVSASNSLARGATTSKRYDGLLTTSQPRY